MVASTIFVRPLARPGLRFLLGHPARFVALGFGVGLIPFAPGTFGTLLALPAVCCAVPAPERNRFPDPRSGFLFVTGVWICDKAGRDLGAEDHKSIVWDETVAFLLVLFFTPAAPLWQAFAFLLFRLFDILKPGPVRAIEQTFRGGFGVMVDDLVAAFFTLLCLTVFKLIVPHDGGLVSTRELFDLAVQVGEALKARGLMLVSAESCTGGWIGAVRRPWCRAARSGTSAASSPIPTRRRWRCWACGKRRWTRHGAVSEQTVCEMVTGALAAQPRTRRGGRLRRRRTHRRNPAEAGGDGVHRLGCARRSAECHDPAFRGRPRGGPAPVGDRGPAGRARSSSPSLT